MEKFKQGNRSLREGIASLAIVQGAEYLIPLLALPYLLRVLGPEEFGKIAFVQAFCMYFVVATEYGFNLTGTRLIAIHRHDKQALSRTFWEIQCIKGTLFAASAILLALLIALFGKLNNLSGILFVGLLPVLGCVMYPLWLLQGLERMREAAMLMIAARVAMLCGVLMFVNGPNDLLLAAALQFGATPIAGIASWVLLVRGRDVHWVSPSIGGLMRNMSESWHTFLATAASTLYRSSNAVILGLMSGPAAVAYYSLAEKIVKAAQEVNRPISQATYPRISALAAQSREAASPLLRRVFIAIAGLSLAVSSALFIFAADIIRILGGAGFQATVPVLLIMAFVPLIGGLNSVLGVQTMLPFGFSAQFSRCVLMAGIFNITIITPLVVLFAERGAALCFFLSEALLLVSMFWFLRQQGFNYFVNLKIAEGH